MSYDYRLFKRRPGEDPHVTARRDSEDSANTPPDPQKEALKRKVADTLIAHNPRLEIFRFDHHEIARLQKISVEEARLKFRYIELDGPEEDSNGIQIILFDDEASVTVPFWHEGGKAADTFREIWGYLEIISRESGYLIYDPQIDRVIDPAEGLDEALACYSGVVRGIRQRFPSDRTEKKPWWKFW